ncbi:MAG: hypothetical protein LBL01_02905 [Bifidobacteriaceae bacterium]|jgi:hypothetical protein|nr:hypothetical protein [Bifidobacteriaceae bacterium]
MFRLAGDQPTFSPLKRRAAAGAAAALVASLLAFAPPPAAANAAPTHHRPGVEGVEYLFDWRDSAHGAMLDHTWYAYAKAGEVIRAATEDTWHSASGAPDLDVAAKSGTPTVRIRILGPDSAQLGACQAVGDGAKCSAAATAGAAGVYRVVWDSPQLDSRRGPRPLPHRPLGGEGRR